MPGFQRLASLLATAVPLLLIVAPVVDVKTRIPGWRLLIGVDFPVEKSENDSSEPGPEVWFWALVLSAAGSLLAQAFRRLAIAFSLRLFTVWMFLILTETGWRFTSQAPWLTATPTPWFWCAFACSVLGATLLGLEIRRVLATPNVTPA